MQGIEEGKRGDKAGMAAWNRHCFGIGNEQKCGLQARVCICSSVALVWFSERSALVLLADCPHLKKKKIHTELLGSFILSIFEETHFLFKRIALLEKTK